MSTIESRKEDAWLYKRLVGACRDSSTMEVMEAGWLLAAAAADQLGFGAAFKEAIDVFNSGVESKVLEAIGKERGEV